MPELTFAKSRSMLVSGLSERNRPRTMDALSHLPWRSCAIVAPAKCL